MRAAPRLLSRLGVVAGLGLLGLGLTACTTGETAPAAETSGSASSPAPSATGSAGSDGSSSADAWATWDAALADIDDEPARWLAVGDSITEGQGASSLGTRWVDLTRDGLRAAHPVEGVTGGVGYRPAAFATYGPDSPWAQWAAARDGRTTTVGDVADLGLRAVELDPGASLRYDTVGTDLDLWWSPGEGAFSYRVDAQAEVVVDTAAGASGGSDGSGGSGDSGDSGVVGVTEVTGLAAGPHVVTISVADDAAASVVLQGLAQFDGDRGRGVALYDSARSGATVSTFTDDLDGFLAAAGTAQPDLVTITLGANDAVTTSPDDLAAGYTTLIEGLQGLDSSPSVLVVDEFTPALSVASAWNGSAADYRSAVEEVARRTGAARVTIDEALAGSGVTDLGSLLSADGLHPNDAGQRVLADYMTATLARR
ncbi:lysophospholipase L1-like esterase [Frigoribacterium sp. PvP120]|uniref:SGNH/GDSL hydrolase family protein n=1 Tax=unclassified Frigoribacterium TaxID=2627005 RepID=UPI001AE84E87|nr:SGNH/GDSL hydrolase family protein [Frigoribacterium sp. PvP121]MBP1239822.1 lysophospholipase L1-like esterase [Frigoribacterium sp. PvP121]